MRRRAAVVLVALAAAACERKAPEPPASPTPTPPPQLSVGEPARALPDGRVEYHVLVRSDSGTVFIPVEIVAARGKGRTSWVRPSATAYAFDAGADRYVPGSGSPEDEYVDAVFPASPQAVSVAVAYDGARPAAEELRLRYRTLSIPDLARRAYVPPEIADARRSPSKKERTPLGARMREVDVARWLSSGFLLREPSPIAEATVNVPGPST